VQHKRSHTLGSDNSQKRQEKDERGAGDKRVGGIVFNRGQHHIRIVMGSLPSLSPQRTRSPAPPVRGFFFFCARLHACPIHSARYLGRASTAAAHTERSLPNFLRG
jgi:hypothetical protein